MRSVKAVRKSDKRITTAAPASRNTPARSTAQLDAFPRSENQRLRQSKHAKAVVSLRLSGDTIAKLDAIAARTRNPSHWQGKSTRADIINRAIALYLKASES